MTVPQLRSQRSAAWILFDRGGAEREAGVAAMRAVLSSLGEAPEDLVAERDETAKQLEQMLESGTEGQLSPH